MTTIERVYSHIKQHPGEHDIDEISKLLKIRPRHLVDQILRKLERAGRITRKRGDTRRYKKFVAFPT